MKEDPAMAGLPYMKFYVGDWFKASEVRCLSLAAKGLWFEMLCYMHQSEPRGLLLISGKPPTDAQLARMSGCTETEMRALIQELDDAETFARDENGIIYCRRMVREGDISYSRSQAGSKGGRPRSGTSKAKRKQTESKTKAKSKQNCGSGSISITEGNGVDGPVGGLFGDGASKREPTKRFVRPSLEQVADYISEQEFSIRPESFFDYYESIGWVVNRKPMKDWQATVRNWERREAEKNPKPGNRVADIRPGARYNATDGTISYDDE